MSSLFTDNIVADGLASGDVASAQKERVNFITGIGSKRQCWCCFRSNVLQIVVEERQYPSLRRQSESTELSKRC